MTEKRAPHPRGKPAWGADGGRRPEMTTPGAAAPHKEQENR